MEKEKLTKIMLIEDDKDIHVIAKYSLENIGNFTVCYCSSGEEALTAFPEFKPQLILLDMMMPKMNGLMTLEALKKLPGMDNVAVVFMTAKTQDSEIQQYKSTGAIDVIAKPFNPNELPATLNNIWQKKPVENNTNKHDDELDKLYHSYIGSLPEKIQEIELSFNNLYTNWDSKNYIIFSSLIHKLHGSSGIYGFTEICELLSKIELIITRYDYNNPADNKVLEQIKLKINELKNLSESHMASPTISVIRKIDTGTVYYLNSNDDSTFGKTWSDNLADQIANYGYQIVIFSDIDTFIAALMYKNPLAIIVSLDFILNPFNININDPNIKDILKLHFKKNYTIFISKSGEFERRIDAFRMHGKSFLLLPFEASELSSELSKLKSLWEEKFKVLVVDDDTESLKYYSNLLTHAGIENRAISSCHEVEKSLHEYTPDLLLLDLNLDACSGMELAAIIRQQRIYEYLPIIYLSVEEKRNIQLQALNVGADDFIAKSSDPNHVIEVIRTRASRYKRIKKITEIDALTGAFTLEHTKNVIEKIIQGLKSDDSQLSIAILKIHNLDSLAISYGYSSVDELLRNLYIFLSTHLGFSRIIGRYSNNQYIIVFPNTGMGKAREELAKLQDQFRSMLHYADGKAYGASFNFGLAAYENDPSIEDFMTKAAENVAV